MNPGVTKRCAEQQDAIFRGEEGPERAEAYDLLCEGQELVCPTNITLRQRIIRAALEGEPGHENGAIAFEQFNALERDEAWLEGPDYWAYIKVAPAWFRRTKGYDILDPELAAAIDDTYSRLVFPDGQLHLPEASAAGYPFDHESAEDDFETPAYRVHRWKRDGRVVMQMNICLDCNPEPRLNEHYHLAGGMVSLWVEGQGLVLGPKPYVEFDAVRGAESADVAECLPKGALPRTWRFSPPEVTRCGLDFQWVSGSFLLASRSITWDSQRVRVVDNGAERVWEIPK